MSKRTEQLNGAALALDTMADRASDRADECADLTDHAYCIGQASAYRYAAQMLRTMTP